MDVKAIVEAARKAELNILEIAEGVTVIRRYGPLGRLLAYLRVDPLGVFDEFFAPVLQEPLSSEEVERLLGLPLGLKTAA